MKDTHKKLRRVLSEKTDAEIYELAQEDRDRNGADVYRGYGPLMQELHDKVCQSQTATIASILRTEIVNRWMTTIELNAYADHANKKAKSPEEQA